MKNMTPAPRTLPFRLCIWLALGLSFYAGAVLAETVIHTEDFTSDLNSDAALTTANWDVGAGQLHLFPEGLIIIGSLGITGDAYAAAWKDDHLLLATGSGNSLVVIETSDPAAPSLVKTHSLPGFARHVTIDGDWAYVSLANGLGIQTVNVADITQPVSGTKAPLDGYTNQTVTNNNWAYAAISNAGVGVVEISDPANPVVLPNAELTDWVRAVAVQGSHLYVGAGTSVTVMNLAVPSAPDSVANIPVSGTAYCLTTAGNMAYVGGPGGLDILDITVPTSPQLLSSLSFGGGAAYHIAVQGDSLFVANGNDGLHIVDISNPSVPETVASRYSAEYFYHTTLNGDLAWTSNAGNGLVVMQADALGLDPLRNRAVSLNLNPEAEPVVRANLVADYADSIRFEISTNGGNFWQDILPDGSWLDFDPQGTDLRWRTTLVQTGPSPGPICNSLTLTFERVHSFPEITNIADVANDTGGQVRVAWAASRFDAAGESQLVTEYSLYRRYDAAKAASLAYPPGSWEYLLTMPADQEATYAATVPTLADSSGMGTNWAVYFVRARTDVAGVFFDSPPDSGYSLNNLAPSPPTGFTVDRGTGSGVQLTWDPAADPNFAHFRLYRLDYLSPSPTPAALYQVLTGTSFFDDSPQYYFYHLTMVNLAGLESDPSPHASATIDLPRGLGVLSHNSPNPFNPATNIAYTVPLGGRTVHLAIYDFRGRLVDTLVDEFVVEGRQNIHWRGTNRTGHTMASGIYTCRLQCGNQTSTLKMTLVR